MSSNDIVEWMAYDFTQSDKWREKFSKDLDIETQQKYSREEEAKRMEDMLKGFGGM